MKHQPGRQRAVFGVALILCTLNFQLVTAIAQGSLTPPGAPAATMKTLQQIEPRTPISSLPFTITAPGSYYVTTNLTDTVGGNGIFISANDVSLDLNGFMLKGTNISGAAVFFSAGKVTNAVVFNGVMRGWPVGGIYGSINAYECRFENLQAIRCGEGISGGWHCLIRNCSAAEGTGNGIAAVDGAVIEDCLAVSNNLTGIATGSSACIIQNCVARFNANGGIITGPHGVIKGCISDFNQTSGILTGESSLVDNCLSVSNSGQSITLGAQSRILNSCARGGNVINIALGPGSLAESCIASFSGTGFNLFPGATASGCSAISNSANGIQVQLGSRAVNCLVRGTGSGGSAVGISIINSNAVVEGCQVTDNSTGISSVGGTLVIRNTARGNSLNYSLPTNCMAGPVISFGSGANPLTGTITNSNPWANFQY